jgi:hypothetical protein
MDWIQVVAPPLLMVLGGIITWFLKSRVDELQAVEEHLRAERRRIYSDILEPYIRLFGGLKTGEGQSQATKKILSYDYRKTAFELGLIGSDEVVRAYNDMMQYFYKAGPSGPEDPTEGIRLWGVLLLKIRRSLGNRKTKLSEVEMLRGMITDIERLDQRSKRT